MSLSCKQFSFFSEISVMSQKLAINWSIILFYVLEQNTHNLPRGNMWFWRKHITRIMKLFSLQSKIRACHTEHCQYDTNPLQKNIISIIPVCISNDFVLTAKRFYSCISFYSFHSSLFHNILCDNHYVFVLANSFLWFYHYLTSVLFHGLCL